MENEFIEKMTNSSNGDLIRITTVDREKYKSEAILAAEQEIKNRNLSVERVEDAKYNIKKREAHLKSIENEPLGIVQKNIIFYFLLGCYSLDDCCYL